MPDLTSETYGQPKIFIKFTTLRDMFHRRDALQRGSNKHHFQVLCIVKHHVSVMSGSIASTDWAALLD